VARPLCQRAANSPLQTVRCQWFLFIPDTLRQSAADLRNIELKARLGDLESARRVAGRIATERIGIEEQVDTYFDCRHGRLKLRQIDNLSAQLVGYARADRPEPKASDYQLVPIADPEALEAALSATLGVRCVVRKRREIFLYHNVRIHLDEVAGLGTFLEFEAVLGPDIDDSTGRAQLQELTSIFALDPADFLSGSYADMLG
jgi:adenylate cyclase, class 2